MKRCLLLVISTSRVWPEKIHTTLHSEIRSGLDLAISNQHEQVSIIDTCDSDGFFMSSDHAKIIRL